MSEQDVRGNMLALREAIASEDENAGVAAAMCLLEAFLVDVARIADALEALAEAK